MSAPQPVAESGAFDGNPQAQMSPYRRLVTPDGIPPVLPGPNPNAMPTPGGMEGPPTYPPPGPYGQQMYETPKLKGMGLDNMGLFGGVRAAPRVWFDGQYLLMFPKNQPITVPLITTSAPADAGVLGRGSTSVLYGAADLPYGAASGFRMSAGFFRPQDQRLGFELGSIYLSPVSNNFYGQSGGNGVPVIARPFLNINGNAQNSVLAAFPTFASGNILGRSTSEFWGMEASGLLNVFRTSPESLRAWSFNLLGGFRYLELAEGINISSASTILGTFTAPYSGTTVANPGTITVMDDFSTRNQFYGGQVGFQSQYYGGRWFLGLTAKAAVGLVQEQLEISGLSGLNNPQLGVVSQAVGGVFANPSNVGKYTNDSFGYLGDLNGTIGFNVTSWLTLTGGYNFIYLNSVLRPGDQINGRVDGTQIPTSINSGGAPVPRENLQLRTTSYYVHGVNFGFIVRY